MDNNNKKVGKATSINIYEMLNNEVELITEEYNYYKHNTYPTSKCSPKIRNENNPKKQEKLHEKEVYNRYYEKKIFINNRYTILEKEKI